MPFQNLLFPSRFKIWGIIFICISLILAFLLVYIGFKPSWLEFKVFAIFSYYIEARFMKFMSNSMMEEIIALFFILGFAILAFSREKDEKPEYNALRLKAFIWSMYAYFTFIVFAILFTYGFAFMYMLMLSMAMPFILFFIIFRFQIRKFLRNLSVNKMQAEV